MELHLPGSVSNLRIPEFIAKISARLPQIHLGLPHRASAQPHQKLRVRCAGNSREVLRQNLSKPRHRAFPKSVERGHYECLARFFPDSEDPGSNCEESVAHVSALRAVAKLRSIPRCCQGECYALP